MLQTSETFCQTYFISITPSAAATAAEANDKLTEALSIFICNFSWHFGDGQGEEELPASRHAHTRIVNMLR